MVTAHAGQPPLRQRLDPQPFALGQTASRDGRHVRRHVVPARRLGGEKPALPARVSDPSAPAAQIATATAPSGRSACSSSDSATAWVSSAASAPLSAARSRTAAGSPSASASAAARVAARKACVTSDIRSRAAWLITSTANSSCVVPACSVSSASCRAACAGPHPRRSTRMPLASSISARPSASACAARTSRLSRSTVAASRPTGESAATPAGPAGVLRSSIPSGGGSLMCSWTLMPAASGARRRSAHGCRPAW